MAASDRKDIQVSTKEEENRKIMVRYLNGLRECEESRTQTKKDLIAYSLSSLGLALPIILDTTIKLLSIYKTRIALHVITIVFLIENETMAETYGINAETFNAIKTRLNNFSREEIKAVILTIEDESWQIKLLKACLDESTILGQRFATTYSSLKMFKKTDQHTEVTTQMRREINELLKERDVIPSSTPALLTRETL